MHVVHLWRMQRACCDIIARHLFCTAQGHSEVKTKKNLKHFGVFLWFREWTRTKPLNTAALSMSQKCRKEIDWKWLQTIPKLANNLCWSSSNTVNVCKKVVVCGRGCLSSISLFIYVCNVQFGVNSLLTPSQQLLFLSPIHLTVPKWILACV